MHGELVKQTFKTRSQVVLSTGEIVDANSMDHRDLWKALRGGSNNFAIVTAVTLKTHAQGPFWGGQTFHKIEQRQEIFQNLESLIESKPGKQCRNMYVLLTTS